MILRLTIRLNLKLFSLFMISAQMKIWISFWIMALQKMRLCRFVVVSFLLQSWLFVLTQKFIRRICSPWKI